MKYRRAGRCHEKTAGATHRWHGIVALVIGVPLAATGLTVIAATPASAAARAFNTPIFTANTTGDVMLRGNAMETCPTGSFSAGSSSLTCAAVQAGTSNGQNNNFNMGYVNIDSTNPPTGTTIFDSSSATIAIPAGATVLYAGLSWSATPAAGSDAGYPALTGVAAPGCSTSVAAGSGGVALPLPKNAALNVASTAGFPSPTGTISVTTSLGVQSFKYTGLTATTFTVGNGGSGGGGTMSTGGAVTTTAGVACEGLVALKTPASSSYVQVTDSQTVDSTAGSFQGYADETAAVLAAGSGTYTVGNVQAGTGGNEYAGWALAIAYRDPTQPVRNLDVYTGFTNVANGASTTINIGGFETPLTGSVVTRLGAVVYEGDRGNIGDTMTLGNNAISNGLNPVNDVENSSMSDLGVAITNRSPSYANTLGTDVDRFDATGFLTNGQTSTTMTFKTIGDSYYPSLVTLATNLYSPSLQTTKTVKDVTSGIASTVKPGDVLAYSMAVNNVGADAATSSILTDAVPAGATYVPGSLVIGGTAVTDASGDDAGDFTGGTVTARLGSGATASAGGTLTPAATTTVAFQVTVNAGDSSGTVIANAAALAYNSATTATAFIGSSNMVSSTVNVVNVNPVLASPAPPSGEINASYADTFSATGGTGPYTYAVSTGAGNSLPAGITLNTSTGVVSGTPTVTGFFNFTITATDANSQVATEAALIYVAPAPVLAFATPLQTADSNSAYSFPLGVNPGTGPYVWSVSTGTLPAGITLNSSTGVLSGTPTGSGTSSFTVKVVDAYGVTATEATSLTITSVPTLTYATPLPAGEVTAPYTDLLTESGGTAPYIWSTTGPLPAGLTLDSSTGLLSGTPTAAGTYTFPVVVTDANNAASAAVSTVVTVNAGPALSFTPPSGEATAPYSATTLAATNGTGPYTYAVTTGSLPTGVALSTTGVWSGSPTTSGTSTFTVTATDSVGGSATQATSISVIAGPSLSFPTPAGEVGVAYPTETLAATGGTGPYTYTTSGPLPAGLTLSGGVLSGTPTTAGTSSFTVTATDHVGGFATEATSITVIAGPVLTFTPPSGEVGVAYAGTFAATGGTGPYTYAVTAGSVPAGLTLTGGVLSGTPTTAGTSSFTVTSTDSNSQHAADATSVTVVAGPTLGFATPPPGVIGTTYTDALTKAGGTGPFVWSVSAGALPAGITLASATGVLSGTATVAGTFPFTVQLIDHDGQSVTEATTLVVDPVAALTSSVTAVSFGTTVTLTAHLNPTAASGTVTFTDLLSSGPQSGQTVTLGTVTLAGGPAQLTIALPAFNTNTLTASYSGDGTYPAVTSPTVADQVNAYRGEVIVDEFRLSGPGGAGDQYVELYNAGAPVPMAGFTVAGSAGATVTLPANAPTLPTRHAYLVAGPAYTLASTATADITAANLGTAGIQLTAPDAVATVVDAVGSSGFSSGTALPALAGTPTDQYAWVRVESAGLPVNTNNNAADFKLVSTTAGVVGGVQSTLGSPAPRATGSPNQNNGSLQSTLLDASQARNAAPNFVYIRGVSGQPGLLTVRRTITNSSAATVTSALIRITSLSEANGLPEPGVASQPARPATVRLIDPATTTSQVVVGATAVTVQNLSPDAPAAASPGGGLNTTLTVPLGAGLAAGATINIAFTFDVDSGGTYWFGYDIDALGGALPDIHTAPAALRRPPFATPNRTSLTASGSASAPLLAGTSWLAGGEVTAFPAGGGYWHVAG
jgi:uncharacterized repeat protein (TIGR01451 family)